MTSTTTSTTTTTTTTLPPGCTVDATYGSVDCRIGDLQTVVSDGVSGGKVKNKLLRRLGKARSSAQRADQLVQAAKGRPAVKRLKTARAQMVGLRKSLRTKGTRKAADASVLQKLKDGASSLIVDLGRLRSEALRAAKTSKGR